MTRHVPLNNVDHHALRIDTRRIPGLGDDVMSVLTFPGEFRQLQAHYPIVFHKDADGAFHPLALLGLREHENLFLDETGWSAGYVPLAIERKPFLIGSASGEPTVHVDLDSPRIAEAGAPGEAVFKEFGGNTPYLERISSVLRALHEGLQQNPGFTALLLSLDLLEPFALDARLRDGTPLRVEGLYTIHEERLRELDGATLERLNRSGALEALHMVIASGAHFRELIERTERRRAADRH
ncbi:SapC family protein [Stenotrophomonas sp. HITSZ_GD]|uniref:SapC family protein n=1 Tax=Stenotrophomonas sp. HITSZ_GD TaxID=3037248 RepID=UPI00240CE58E|nr:SapC family protein [Stenotrophomonas sp. HITSZ_GD]MDG2524169.1 SapC family protein [Stenotrophomonas sp. HITSZ_GD]